jgi:hypothetical protein
MARKDYTAEQAIGMLREAEVRLSWGEKMGKICRGLGISELLPVAPNVQRAEGRSGASAEGPRAGEPASEESSVRADAGQADPEGSA